MPCYPSGKSYTSISLAVEKAFANADDLFIYFDLGYTSESSKPISPVNRFTSKNEICSVQQEIQNINCRNHS